ncbi:ribosomal RNA processing protein 1 homolog [Solenopsis invicta]|uniref:ribosomal RNA processing protein 1 homolog n=1 Tax=Solenopsis invicta TaxID=13686 RepID=UPI000595FDAE|nr:ribosomal RNA processing protein 1 homolog [Solenopsis invicta]
MKVTKPTRGRGDIASASPRKNETKTSKIKSKKVTETKDKSKKALVIAQEIKIARLLANNDKKVRDQVLKRLNKWLTVRSQSSFVFTKTDFMSLWKGLFYCMWMSDKMLTQEELAESLSKLVHCLKSKDTIVLYTSCALQTLATEWFGIDQYRLDKFSMLVRRILRQTFVICKNQSWNMEWVTDISQIFTQLFLHVKTAQGFNLHVTEIYMEELAKISNGNVPENVVHEFIKPFAVYLITTDDERQMKHIMRHIFRHLIFQSDIGMDYTEKFKAWRTAGFPCAYIDDMQKEEISDTEENSDNEDKQLSETETQNEITNEKPLDPRAGRVDVELPQIPFNAAKIAELLSTYKFHPSSTAKSRRQLVRLIHEFTELSQGRMPLGVKRVRKSTSQKKYMDSRKAAVRLVQFEKELLSDKPNKKRKRERNDSADRVSTNNSKNENSSDLEFDTYIGADSKSKLTAATNKANKKRKIEKNDTAICDQVSVNNSKYGSAGLKSKLTNATETAKANLRNVDVNTVSLNKKRKRSDSMCNIPSTKSETIKTKKKLQLETSKKNKATKIKLNKKSKKSIADKNVEHKTKKAIICKDQICNNTDQCTSTSPISSKKVSLKEIKVSLKEINNKSVAKKAITKTKITRQKKPLKNELCKKKKQTNLSNSPMEKKKVIFGLSRNTAQHTSEYIKQVRRSPGIPFDANKKPLASVLKMNPIPSPLNPFYKN